MHRFLWGSVRKKLTLFWKTLPEKQKRNVPNWFIERRRTGFRSQFKSLAKTKTWKVAEFETIFFVLLFCPNIFSLLSNCVTLFFCISKCQSSSGTSSLRFSGICGWFIGVILKDSAKILRRQHPDKTFLCFIPFTFSSSNVWTIVYPVCIAIRKSKPTFL